MMTAKTGNGRRLVSFPFPRFPFPLLLLVLLLGGPLAAQIPYDSLPADTLTRDTVNTTEKYLKAQTANRIVLPVLPLVGVEVPLPPASRVVLTRDSLGWATAETVADLLQRIPGVYLWRGGWLGRTEYPDFRGRGPTSAEYLVDGLPYIPIGPDSVGIDPSLFSLSLYDRIEIERWPGQLRVHLFTRRHDRQAPYSHVGIAAGDKDIARYIGSLEKRYPSGMGLSFGGERFVAPTGTGATSDFDITNYWIQLGYVPSTRFGVQAQLLHSSPDRKPFVDFLNDSLDLRLTGSRSDAQFRVYWRKRPDDLGIRADAFLGRTTWKGSGVDDQVRQGGVILGWRSPTIGLSARAMTRSRLTPVDLFASAGWTPAGLLSAAVEAGYQTHDRDRTSRWVGLRGGLGLPFGFTLGGALKQGTLVQAPSVLTDRAQSLTDWQTTLQWERRWAGLELGYGHTDAFRSQPYRPYLPSIDSLRPAAGSEWVTLGWRLAPRSWLTLQGWYSDPVGTSPDGIPPTHSLTSATIRSKFWRTFPSGIFDFKATIAMESWGDGVIGRNATGQAIALDGATFLRTMIEIQLDHFQLYWDRNNLQGSRKSYVPGFNLPILGATFGVRWQFAN